MCTFVCLCIYMCIFKSMHVSAFQYWSCAICHMDMRICHMPCEYMIYVFVPYAICHADIYMPCAMRIYAMCHVPGPRERGQMRPKYFSRILNQNPPKSTSSSVPTIIQPFLQRENLWHVS